jgi:hypothetical protein
MTMKASKLIGITIFCLLCLCSSIYAQDEKQPGNPQTPPPAIPVFGDPIVRKITYEVIKQEPKLGVKISGYPKPTDSIAGKSDELYSIYHVLFREIKYSVRADSNGRIRYIMTTDDNFETPEGVKEGMTFREVRPLSKGEMIKEDYGFYLPLNSGWKAAFRTKAEGELLSNEKVSWLFKEN